MSLVVWKERERVGERLLNGAVLTALVTVNIGDLGGNDSSVEESFISYTKATLSLILFPLPSLLGSLHLLERSRWNSIVNDPVGTTNTTMRREEQRFLGSELDGYDEGVRARTE